MHAHRSTAKPVISIVGGESLLGKEVQELLESGRVAANVKLVTSGDEDGASILTRGRDEPLALIPLQSAELDGSRLVLLAGSRESSQKAYELVRKGTSAPVVIDLSGALEHEPDARLRAPMVESGERPPASAIQIVAHPASIALALLLTHLRKAGTIRRSVVNVFEPASERGQAGLDELQKQTVGLLSLKPLVKDIFDAQVSFNMLSAFGSESRYSLEGIEQTIDRHLASLLARGGPLPMPSLRLAQAPVFHGYSVSAWVEFESILGLDQIEKALESGSIDVRGKEHEPPTNVGVAGQNGIVVGGITADRNDPKACWFWVVADNLRIAAENAVEVVRELL